MGHRHMFNALPIPETDGDQGWNHTKQPYKPIARTGACESSSLVRPVENMAIQGGPFPSSATRSTGYSSFILKAGQSRDPFPHQPADRNSRTLPNNYLHHPSSSSLSGQNFPRVDEASHNQNVGRVSHKRKSPSVAHLPASTSRYDVGSSSNLQLSADPWHETTNTATYHTHWKYPPGYRVDSLSVGGESMPKNVRSRAGVDLEHNPVRSHLSSSSLCQPFSSRSSDQTNSVDFSRWSSNTPTTELNCLVSPAGHGVTIGSGSSFFNHDPNSLNALNGHSNGSAHSGGNSNYTTSNRTTVPQNAIGYVNQSIRGIRISYDQRSAPTSTSNFQAGQVAASNEGLQVAAESYSSINQRVVSAIRLLYSERNGGAGMSSERYRSSTEQALIAAVRHSALNGSRNPVDRHRDMRLDVDNMSYEELLVLEERIGSVSTGLSDSLISKCLTESIYCSSDEDDERCIICLEEYKHMDDVGNLKCGHDFHVGCIRKWLSMKNLCPICKSSAMDESKKRK